MTLRVPYIADESIECDAEALLAQFAHARGLAIQAPIPIEDIVEKHLKLHVEFDDLHRLLGVPRGTEPDIFGAIWLETGEIVIDESLDPEVRPAIEGRKLVFQAWRDRFGNDDPRMLRRQDRIVVPCDVDEEIAAVVRSFDQARDDEVLEHFVRPFAEQFMVSPIAMRIRLERLELLHREVPRQRSLLVRS
jgi:hypothetical protein